MHYAKKIMWLLLTAIFLTACGSRTEETAAVYVKLSPREAQDLLSAQVLIVDVRSTEEFEQGRIRSAVLLPVDEINTRAASVLPGKEQIIFVYCRSGNRSRTAARALIEMGYTRVYDIGGIREWLGETE